MNSFGLLSFDRAESRTAESGGDMNTKAFDALTLRTPPSSTPAPNEYPTAAIRRGSAHFSPSSTRNAAFTSSSSLSPFVKSPELSPTPLKLNLTLAMPLCMHVQSMADSTRLSMSPPSIGCG